MRNLLQGSKLRRFGHENFVDCPSLKLNACTASRQAHAPLMGKSGDGLNRPLNLRRPPRSRQGGSVDRRRRAADSRRENPSAAHLPCRLFGRVLTAR